MAPHRQEASFVDFDDIKDKVAGEKDQIDEGLDKAGDAVKDKFGHEDQVDLGVDKAKDAVEKLDDN